ncbi:hypothetical protein LP416_21110 [Polaromonas sp. P2-4]|nr:hypothetical protein LP416_21110 [Polaromonas sp. P2-4]
MAGIPSCHAKNLARLDFPALSTPSMAIVNFRHGTTFGRSQATTSSYFGSIWTVCMEGCQNIGICHQNSEKHLTNTTIGNLNIGIAVMHATSLAHRLVWRKQLRRLYVASQSSRVSGRGVLQDFA